MVGARPYLWDLILVKQAKFTIKRKIIEKERRPADKNLIFIGEKKKRNKIIITIEKTSTVKILFIFKSIKFIFNIKTDTHFQYYYHRH